MLRKREVRRGAEKMGIPSFAGAGLAWENGSEGAGGLVVGFICVCAARQALECGLHSAKVFEGVETVGATAQFARSLRAAQHEQAEHSRLIAAKVEDGADPVLVLGNPGIADRSDEPEIFEGMEGLAKVFFGQVENGVATGALVARVKESIERKRIVLWRGDLFFNERPQDAELREIKLHGY